LTYQPTIYDEYYNQQLWKKLSLSKKPISLMTELTSTPANSFMICSAIGRKVFTTSFNPYFANVLEGHPLAMQRLTLYMEGGNESDFDFGMELIDGEIDIDTNLAIEEFSEEKTVYAIGSQFHDDEDNPLFLIKNDATFWKKSWY
jgi:hypothetical protein